MCWVKNNEKERPRSSTADAKPQPKFGRQQKWLTASNSQVSVGKNMEYRNTGGVFIVISLLK